MRSGPAPSRTSPRRRRRRSISRSPSSARYRRRRPPRPARPRSSAAVLGDADGHDQPGRERHLRARCACARRARGARGGRAVPRCTGAEQAGDRGEPDRARLGEGHEQLASASARHRARAPTKRSRLTATSTSARSGACPTLARRAPPRARARVAAPGRWRPARWPGRRPWPRASRERRCSCRSRARRSARRRTPWRPRDACRRRRARRSRSRPARHLARPRASCPRGPVEPHVELLERRQAALSSAGAVRRELAVQRRREPVAGGHHQRALDARRGEPGSSRRPSRPSRRCRTPTRR